MRWLLDVHSPRSTACVRITSPFTVLTCPNSLAFTLFLFRSALSVSYVKSNRLESVTMAVPIMVTTSRHQDSLSLTDQSSMSSISTKSTLNPNYSAEQASHSDTVSFYHSAKSFNESEMQGQSSPPAGILLTAASASVDSGPLHFSNAAESMMPVHAPSNVETV